jgi:hypothetical protein
MNAQHVAIVAAAILAAMIVDQYIDVGRFTRTMAI